MTEHRSEEWRNVIAAIRNYYHGPVSYNTDKYQEENVTWWDCVDMISSSGYYPIDQWEQELDRIERTVQKFKKPFFFAEAGCMSRKGSSMVPNNWANQGALRLEEQPDWYRAMFEACAKRSWVNGFAMWEWAPVLPSRSTAARDTSYEICNKPVQEVIKDYYGRDTKENNIQQTSEQDLWQEEAAMMHIFSRNRKNNLRTLLSLFKGHYGALAGSVFFFIIKHSPTWVLPIVTANIINAVTDHNGNITKILILNTILMIVFLVQNIPTNYIHTWLYAKTVRTVEKELREALVCKLQQLLITYHKEMQSGRLQSKIMRDVEQIQNLASQIFISLLTIILNIGVSFGVVIFKSRIVFLFFLCTIPVSVLIIVGFKGKIKTHNRAFRKEMEETSAKVMEMVEMIPVTKAHALEDQEARKMSEQLRKVAEKRASA